MGQTFTVATAPPLPNEVEPPVRLTHKITKQVNNNIETIVKITTDREISWYRKLCQWIHCIHVIEIGEQLTTSGFRMIRFPYLKHAIQDSGAIPITELIDMLKFFKQRKIVHGCFVKEHLYRNSQDRLVCSGFGNMYTPCKYFYYGDYYTMMREFATTELDFQLLWYAKMHQEAFSGTRREQVNIFSKFIIEYFPKDTLIHKFHWRAVLPTDLVFRLTNGETVLYPSIPSQPAFPHMAFSDPHGFDFLDFAMKSIIASVKSQAVSSIK